jgi:predicted SprT family Zn-dependent metalloprotease
MATTRSAHGSAPKGTRKFLILVSPDLKKMQAVTVMTVLHELVHCEQWDEVSDRTQHGRKFENRMKQLVARGAFKGLW